MKQELTLQVLSGNNGREFTKRDTKTVHAFFYDEDCLWLDIGKKRYGVPFDTASKLRAFQIKELDDDLKKWMKNKLGVK